MSMRMIARVGFLSMFLPLVVNAQVPAGWSCVGNCGTLGPNGVVTSPPGGGQYLWVSTNDGTDGVNLGGVGGTGIPTNGSRLLSPIFAGTSGSTFSFFFNYVTSDGAGYADYGWARLLTSGGSEVTLLFTARTTVAGSSVPGFSMPAPAATLTPANVTIIPGGPVWSPLGGWSGACFAEGCGYTGWIRADFVLQSTGMFQLETGVTNWDDEFFDSGMAVKGLAIDDVFIDAPVSTIPEPSTFLLMATTLSLLALNARRHRGSD